MLRSIKPLIVVMLTLAISSVEAQQLGLHFMENVWQSSRTNPAFFTPQKVVYAFPSLHLSYHNTAASYNDLIVKEGNKKILDLDNVIGGLDDNNFIRAGFDLELMNVSFGNKLWRASIGQSIKYRSMVNFPKELAELGWNGNAALMGQEVNIGPKMQGMAYGELGLGFALNLVKMSVGGRVKILSGIFDSSTGNSDIKVQTDGEFYQSTFTTDYELNIASVGTHGDLDDFDLNFDDVSATDFILGKNLGVAIDLGINFKVNEKLTVAASLIDIGGIKWKTNVSNYTSQGTYTYEGLDLSDVIEENDDSFDAIKDTLEEIFDFKETNNSYSTALPAKAYLSANYRVNPFLRLGGLIYTERFGGKSFTGVAVSATTDLGKIFSLGAVYSVFKNTYTNVGLNAALKLGPVQLFGVTDNVFAVFQPLDSRHMNARFGLNLAFN